MSIILLQTQHSPACGQASCVPLYGHGGQTYGPVPFALNKHSHVLLDHNTTRTKAICSQLLHVGHLTSPEEYLGPPKLEFVFILQGYKCFRCIITSSGWQFVMKYCTK